MIACWRDVFIDSDSGSNFDNLIVIELVRINDYTVSPVINIALITLRNIDLKSELF